jgi:hypothetical protein
MKTILHLLPLALLLISSLQAADTGPNIVLIMADDFVYCWYNRDMQPGATQVSVRNQRYKLYASGAFYDVPNDQ